MFHEGVAELWGISFFLKETLMGGRWENLGGVYGFKCFPEFGTGNWNT